jgi:S-adenosylmethionine synthetase
LIIFLCGRFYFLKKKQMLYKPKIYTVESVTAGHPDKVCDQISDAILDACLAQDPMSRVAVEALGGHGELAIFGEVTTSAEVNFKKVARDFYKKIGYQDKLKIITNIVKQSPDIAQGVNTGGAGDQGIMYGYATAETPEFMPRGIVLVHKLTKGLQDLRESGEIDWLGPDGKAQVTVEGKKYRTILVSTQHKADISQEQVREALVEKLIKPLVGDITGIEILVNPTGKFAVGGFEADTGLTGRKSWWTPTAGSFRTAEAAFPEKTRPKWTAPAPIWPVLLPKIWWLKERPGSVWWRWLMPLGERNP